MSRSRSTGLRPRTQSRRVAVRSFLVHVGAPTLLMTSVLVCSLPANAFGAEETPLTPTASLAPTTPNDDSRFGEIGRSYDPVLGTSDAPASAPGEEEMETPRPAAGAGVSHVGHVTYGEGRVDVPLSARWSLIPAAAFLSITPYSATDSRTWYPYAGGGVGFRPMTGWGIEATTMIGPRTHGLATVTGNLGVSHDIGADWEHDIPPPLTVEAILSATQMSWENGLGPAGPNLLQAYVQGQVTIRAINRLTFAPRGMYFVYDKSLDNAIGPRLGTVSTLARIGSYAPRASFGFRAAYLIDTFLSPIVDVEHIVYAGDIGNGTSLLAGGKVKLRDRTTFMLAAGAIFNRVGGTLVPPEYALGAVPMVLSEMELGF